MKRFYLALGLIGAGVLGYAVYLFADAAAIYYSR
jgi:hypothetical protein